MVVSTTANPTITDTKIASGRGVGTFTADLSGLTPATTYHVRAFGTNSVGTSYGEDKTFTTGTTTPTITTTAISELTIVAAKSGGNIISDGGSTVTARGVCWGLNPNPTIADSKTTDGSGSGSFTSTIDQLTSNKKYYVRAYATNSVGTAYGPEINFNTPVSPIPTTGLVGWWPFNGNAKDESGNGNDGVVSGATLTTDRNGSNNKAYTFDGINDGIICSDSKLPFASDDRSISLWINDGSLGQYCSIPLRYGIHSPGNGFWILHSNLCNPSYPNGTLRADFYDYGVWSTSTMPNNEWHLITVTLSNQTCTIYLDATIIGQGTVTINTLSANGKLYFGGDYVSVPNYFFNGKIDDIAIYNRALTADEILKIYNGTGF